MTAVPLPGVSTDQLGIIGTRQLVCVQMFDIARLTSHPIALIPGRFISITGRGPKDSNESGKTCFLSALSLLLGDPEWKTGGTGASNVAALLFEPITAGVAAQRFTAATEGYVVGVFAEPDDPVATAHTVWMRLSSSRPHLQVRHASGVHLVRADTDRDRHDQAALVYRTLGGDPLGGGDYAKVLYGRTPRVLAYVASRGQVRSRPSLLKLDAGTFTPEQIGDALMTLTGRAALFERDQEDRRALAESQEKLSEVSKRDQELAAHEDAILRAVAGRERLRADANGAADQWRAYRARAVLDAYARAESAQWMLKVARADREEIARRLAGYEQLRKRLRDKAALSEAVEDTATELARIDEAYENAIREEVRLNDALVTLEKQIGDDRIVAANYDSIRQGSADEAIRGRDETAKRLEASKRLRGEAEAQVHDFTERLEQARKGEFGHAGELVRKLAAVGLRAVGLAEALELTPQARPQWEARLFPWREAVCVATTDNEDLRLAIETLADIPGAVLITPGIAQSPVSNGTNESLYGGLPSGIAHAPAQAINFLRALAKQQAHGNPVSYVVDPETGVKIIGGFSEPIVGREDMCAFQSARLAQARRRLEDLDQEVDKLILALQQAEDTVTRAQAAERIARTEPQATDLAGRLAIHRTQTLGPLHGQREEARAAHSDAEQTLRTRESELNRLSDQTRQATDQLRAKDGQIDRLKIASRPDDSVLAAWSLGREQARVELGWPEQDDDKPPDEHLADEATPPTQTAEASTEVERRRAVTLAQGARARLAAALAAFDLGSEGAGTPPADLAGAAARYLHAQKAGEDDSDGSLFETVLATLQGWLEDQAELDAAAEEQVQQARAARAREIDFVTTQTTELKAALAQTQEVISERAAGALDAISKALSDLDHSANGMGADLQYDIGAPNAPEQDWTCRVTPRWRRNPAGPLLPYDNLTNTAQEKLFSIHLVLAALLAAPNPRGRVLILDELGDSLGAEHRREVLDAISRVANEHGITVLGTCQDTILVEAQPYCGEILYFHYPSKSEALNRPTRIFGFDNEGARIELTADDLIAGRTLT
jgi:chromosome segregation protein